MTLKQRLRAALEAADQNPDRLEPDTIAAIDQLHVGGRGATRRLAERAGLTPGERVLDLGCGTGGSARQLAAGFGVCLIGVDITAEFVTTARWLSDATGLGALVDFIAADAQRLPLAAACCDAVWSQHALLNVPSLATALAETRRVLRPGGRLLLHEVLRGENAAPLDYPVPWSDGTSPSHLLEPDDFQGQLAAAGWRCCWWDDVSEQALNWRQRTDVSAESGAQPAPDKAGITPALIFGSRFAVMGRNLSRNLADRRIRIVQAEYALR